MPTVAPHPERSSTPRRSPPPPRAPPPITLARLAMGLILPPRRRLGRGLTRASQPSKPSAVATPLGAEGRKAWSVAGHAGARHPFPACRGDRPDFPQRARRWSGHGDGL